MQLSVAFFAKTSMPRDPDNTGRDNTVEGLAGLHHQGPLPPAALGVRHNFVKIVAKLETEQKTAIS
ncbi:hypothetical protein ACFOHS_03640 [Jhaorihella thermophila]